ncbi:MAG: tryptophan synthase beta chain [Solirubrobacteraceae bacterium]|jgi:tryptophan synthase beta chain|nr:tryptophan synthase beta chain [Solirubrobacteraceae bacterium]
MSETTKFLLSEDAIPTHWVNLLPDLPGEPLPPLNPQTMAPAGPPDLTPIFPMELIGQEVSGEPDIEIPEEVRNVYRLWRPSPLFRARRLERLLKTPAHIYYKYEGVSPAGSHKPNTAVPQAFANSQAGVKKLTTETGAGQWGSSLAFACSLFGLECEVFMVGSSYDQKPYRRSMMQTWGATVHRSPSKLTQSGIANQEHLTGSLGIAISEAVEVAAQDPDSNYALGSVLNHVLLHQTIIGQEAIAQMEMAGEEPDVIIGCVGGGSNFAGLAFPWLRRKLRSSDGSGPRFVAAEPAACPTLTKGVYAYDFGDTAGLTPLMAMYTLGHGFVPPPVHAGGLRYHGDAPMVCALLKAGLLEARAYRQNETFAAALQFARSEGIIPAPEPAHAIRAAIEEAQAATAAGDERVILFGLCGHGNLDLAAYDAYLGGTLEDPEFSQEDLDAALAGLPEGTPSLA